MIQSQLTRTMHGKSTIFYVQHSITAINLFGNNLWCLAICRSIWLVASIINMTDMQRTTIFDIASKNDKTVLLLDKCSRSVMKRSKFGVRCAYGTTQTHYFPSTFAQSQFCLIAKTERLFQLNFIEALASNCIPVIFADNIVLPFNEVRRQPKKQHIFAISRFGL